MTDDGQQTLTTGVGDKPRPPRVRRKLIVRSPHTGKIAGFIGVERKRPRPIRVATFLRTGGHYYRSGDGWAISDSILDACRRYDVSRILFHDGTTPDDDVWEFQAHYYYDDVPPDEYPMSVLKSSLEDPDDTQSYVPKDEALYEWHNYAAALFEREFSTAVGDIIDKRGTNHVQL